MNKYKLNKTYQSNILLGPDKKKIYSISHYTHNYYRCNSYNYFNGIGVNNFPN